MLGRLRRRRRYPYYGDCPDCGHDWRSHAGGPHSDPESASCDECGYERDHGERPRDAALCPRPAPEPPA